LVVEAASSFSPARGFYWSFPMGKFGSRVPAGRRVS